MKEIDYVLMNYEHRFTPEKISVLKPNEVFVFGSNEKGIHGKGAALLAYKQFGAIWGKGSGKWGQTYAIPTKLDPSTSLSLDVIACHIDKFITYVKNEESHHRYLVTKIGCGLAGYTIEAMAPLFIKALSLSRILLPKEFFECVLYQYKYSGYIINEE
jgi:hypothetical protein